MRLAPTVPYEIAFWDYKSTNYWLTRARSVKSVDEVFGEGVERDRREPIRKLRRAPLFDAVRKIAGGIALEGNGQDLERRAAQAGFQQIGRLLSQELCLSRPRACDHGGRSRVAERGPGGRFEGIDSARPLLL